MFACAGTLYVYSIHSRHCLNVVTERPGLGSAILIRAVEPYEGLERMAQLRCLSTQRQTRLSWLRGLATGPGRLCQAIAVDRSLDGCDLTHSSQIHLERAPECVQSQAWRVASGVRIGISQAEQRRLRWFLDGHQLVSGCARDHARGRTWRFQA